MQYRRTDESLPLARVPLRRVAAPTPAPSVREVDALMLDLACGERDDVLGPIVAEHLAGGGRRLRARLALEACDALGVEGSEAVVWAAACELLHNASLVHDDLQDGDTTRRGRPTTWAVHGAAQAINAGDLMLMLPVVALRASNAPAATKWELALAATQAAELTVRGQAQELALNARGRASWAEYLDAASAKSASFFALPVQGAAILAGLGDEAAALAAPFARLGALFQLQDDVCDLYGDKGRESRGADLREGKVSALVAEHLRLAPRDADRLGAVLRAPRESTSDADVAWAASAFEESGALASVVAHIHRIADEVMTAPALARHPDLQSAARLLVTLSLRPIEHVLDASRERRAPDAVRLLAAAAVL
jgi:geranylgeranyl diphosphate synthase type I